MAFTNSSLVVIDGGIYLILKLDWASCVFFGFFWGLGVQCSRHFLWLAASVRFPDVFLLTDWDPMGWNSAFFKPTILVGSFAGFWGLKKLKFLSACFFNAGALLSLMLLLLLLLLLLWFLCRLLLFAYHMISLLHTVFQYLASFMFAWFVNFNIFGMEKASIFNGCFWFP